MRKLTLKTIVASALCLLGANNAWAAAGDVVTNINIDFSNAITNGAVAGTVNSMTIGTHSTYPTEINADGRLVLGKTTNTVTIPEAQLAGKKDVVNITFDLAFGKLNNRNVSFSFKDASGNAIGSFDFSPYSGTLTTNLGVETGDMYFGFNTVLWERKVSFNITVDYNAKTITTNTTCLLSGASKPATNATHTVALENTNPIASFVVASTYDNQGRRCEFDNLKMTTTLGNYEVETVPVTIKYVDTDGNDLTSILPEGTVTFENVETGTTYAPSYPQTIVTDDYVYTYKSGGTAVEVSEETTFTLVYTKSNRAKVNVVLNAVCGSELLETTTIAENYPEGKSLTYGFSKYIVKDGKLYQAVANNPSYYVGTVDASSEPIVINYNEVTPSDALGLYFNDFNSGEFTTGSTQYQRCSGGLSMAVQGELVLVPAGAIPAGIYRFEINHFKNRTPKFYVGDKEIGTFSTGANSGTCVVSTFVDVEITGLEDVKAVPGGSTYTDEMDYVLAVKTADLNLGVAYTIPAGGLGTLVSDKDLDFSNVEGVNVYIATGLNAQKNCVAVKKVQGAIQAGTAILVEGTPGEITIAEATADTYADVSGNKLVGSATESINLEGVACFVVSASDGKFHPCSGGTLAAGKAYLDVDPEEMSADAKLAIEEIVEGGATAISSVSSVNNDNTIYNLQGVRVEKARKGIYIVNGKKVIY